MLISIITGIKVVKYCSDAQVSSVCVCVCVFCVWKVWALFMHWFCTFQVAWSTNPAFSHQRWCILCIKNGRTGVSTVWNPSSGICWWVFAAMYENLSFSFHQLRQNWSRFYLLILRISRVKMSKFPTVPFRWSSALWLFLDSVLIFSHSISCCLIRHSVVLYSPFLLGINEDWGHWDGMMGRHGCTTLHSHNWGN